jgi:hypothetical protein
MDTTRWKEGDSFPVLDLIAQFAFKSASSMSFELGTHLGPGSPRTPEMKREESLEQLLQMGGSAFFIIGWLDIHHPCEGSHRLQLRVGLPDRYVSWESMRDLVPQVLAALGLQADESYHVHLAGLSKETSTEWPQSGFVDASRGCGSAGKWA